ncbi:MAG TPA: dipeptidase PepE [Flavobacteriaceae bacterium]|nr:dipeptidase PepE [Flavobacteriaceae bacterium]|tara:strand:+ start:1024 stop:1734 length:711 start_codon:yes stop_codon:yes gene_type:complete
MKKMILASTSTIYGSKYLEYLFPVIKNLFSNSNNILFIPYARPNGITLKSYTDLVKDTFEQLNLNIFGIDNSSNPAEDIKRCDGIFIGGGNSFLLLDSIQKNKLIAPITEKVNSGTPLLGTSAGTNICGVSIGTTNDMPIVHPSSLKSLNLIPFNINPHYIDPILGSKHMGESREIRIKEFHKFNDQIVIGLREGSYLQSQENNIILKGPNTARIFKKNNDPLEIEPEFNLNKLLN